MRWYLKAAAYHVFSTVPGGRRLYQLSQHHLTGTITPTRDRIGYKLEVALRYWSWLAERDQTAMMKNGTHMCFGAGWHPSMPLLFHSLGVESQYLLDIAPLLNADLVMETTRLVREVVNEAKLPHLDQVVRLPEQPSLRGDQWRAWLRSLGIEYIAPYDSSAPVLADSIDVVNSTQVLPYIGRANLEVCLRMLHRVLKPRGLFFGNVYLRDYYADSDPHITPYNHLKFSPWWWDHVVNSRLMVLNRLKARDYRELLEQAGFVLETFDVAGPTEVELRQLDTVKIHRSFARYSREELAARNLFFVARKP
ncbi:MAG: methyltransferase domain-containing protein [Verrucomicrobiia bacterium]